MLVLLHATACLAQSTAQSVSILPTDTLRAFAANTSTQSAAIVPVKGAPGFSEALKLTTAAEPVEPYTIQIVASSVAPIKKGDVLLGTFWLRNIHSKSGFARTDLILENRVSFNKSAYFSAVAGPEWKKFSVPFTAIEDEPAGDAHINFHLGFTPQVIEIGGVSVVDYHQSVDIASLPTTKVTYDGRSPDAPWRAAASARIDKYRKGNLKVVVLDLAGRPIKNASVSVRMTRHAFGFGTMVDDWFLMANDASGATYRAMLPKYFNKIVLGMFHSNGDRG